jgi:hypothetical protein
VRDLVRAFRVSERALIDLAPRVGYSIRRIREHFGCWRFRDLEDAKGGEAARRCGPETKELTVPVSFAPECL